MLVQCLDDGFIRLVDYMASDIHVVQAARTSYGKGTKSLSDDRGLIRYLMGHWHTTPFEGSKFHVRVPMDCWRQWVRHRMASINEYSTRYSEAIDSAQTAMGEWRLQSSNNKQGSSGGLRDWPDGYRLEPPKDGDDSFQGVVLDPNGHPTMMVSELEGYGPTNYLTSRENWFQNTARKVYDERLAFGVAREQARKDLPLSTYTEAYWKIDLHNLFHFLRLRMDSHAQLEIRTFANGIGELVKPIVPWSWEAFLDYRLHSMQLSALDVEVLRSYLSGDPDWLEKSKSLGMSKREREEFCAKAPRLGINFDAVA